VTIRNAVIGVPQRRPGRKRRDPRVVTRLPARRLGERREAFVTFNHRSRSYAEGAGSFYVAVGHAWSIEGCGGMAFAVEEDEAACRVGAMGEFADAGVGYCLGEVGSESSRWAAKGKTGRDPSLRSG